MPTPEPSDAAAIAFIERLGGVDRVIDAVMSSGQCADHTLCRLRGSGVGMVLWWSGMHHSLQIKLLVTVTGMVSKLGAAVP